MANPQIENGFTRIANDILKALSKIRIAGEPRQILDFIMLKTYGFHKKEDRISLSQFKDGTKLKHRAVCKAIDCLLKMNIIIKRTSAKKGTMSFSMYCVQKDYEKWKPVPKKALVPKKAQTSAKNGPQPVPFLAHTKDIFTKDILQKKYILSGKPDCALCRNVIDFLNKETDSHYKHTSKKTQGLIRARWNEGFREEDFYYVIKIKAAQWMNDNDFRKFLRPETLFSNKFEGYRNEKQKKTDDEIGDEEVARYYREHPERRHELTDEDIIKYGLQDV